MYIVVLNILKRFKVHTYLFPLSLDTVEISTENRKRKIRKYTLVIDIFDFVLTIVGVILSTADLYTGDPTYLRSESNPTRRIDRLLTVEGRAQSGWQRRIAMAGSSMTLKMIRVQLSDPPLAMTFV